MKVINSKLRRQSTDPKGNPKFPKRFAAQDPSSRSSALQSFKKRSESGSLRTDSKALCHLETYLSNTCAIPRFEGDFLFQMRIL